MIEPGTNPLLSIHIPKTAGTSFRVMLEQVFEGEIALAYHNESGDPLLKGFWGRKSLTREEEARVRDHIRRRDVRCIHGHFQVSRFRGAFPHAPMITFVRHPVDRIVSEYHFQVDRDEIRHTPEGLKVRSGEWSAEDYLRFKASENVYRKYGLEDHFDELTFVGVVEEFEDSVRLLTRRIPELEGMTSVHRNRGRSGDREDDGPLDDALREELESLASADMEIYRRAAAALRRQLATSP